MNENDRNRSMNCSIYFIDIHSIHLYSSIGCVLMFLTVPDMRLHSENGPENSKHLETVKKCEKRGENRGQSSVSARSRSCFAQSHELTKSCLKHQSTEAPKHHGCWRRYIITGASTLHKWCRTGHWLCIASLS